MTPRRAGAAAIAMAVLGFGAMTIASALRLGDLTLPGLFSFRSATVGDGLLLPLITYVLLRSAGPVCHRGRVAAAGLFGTVAGALTQVWWLTDPTPRLNWSLPAPGTFNAIGWYHGVFLTVSCGFFAAAAAVVLDRARDAARTPAGTVAGLGALFPALAFSGLLTVDNDGSPTLMIVPAATLVAAVLAWVTRQVGWSVLVCAAAALPALSFSWLFLPDRMIDVVTVLPMVCAGLVGAFAASTVIWADTCGRILAPLCIALAAAGSVHIFAAAPTVTISRLAWGCVLSLAMTIVQLLLVRALFAGRVERSAFFIPLAATPITAFALSGRYFAQQPAQASTYGVTVGVVVAFLFLFVTAKPVRAAYDAVIDAEVADTTRSELAAVKWSAFLAITTMYVGALLSCVASLIGTTSADRWVAGTGDVRSLAPLALGLVALVGVSWLSGRVIAPLACLAWTALIGMQFADGYGHWAQIVLSGLIALLALLFLFEGFIANVGYLHGALVNAALVFPAATCALAASATTAWMTGPAHWSAQGVTSVPYAMATLALGWAACMLLPWVVARAMPGAHPPERHIIGTPLAGVLQDSFIVMALATSVAWAPVLFLAHLNNMASWSGAVFPYLALLSKAYVYAMKSNIGHVHRERDRIAGLAKKAGEPVSANAQRALTALDRHISRQNVIALAALLPLGFVIVLSSELNGFDRKGLQQIWRV